jgi:hypothetical protein
VVSSVAQSWSAFPYAATRCSRAPLFFTLPNSPVWRVLRAYSPEPIPDVHVGLSEAKLVLAELPP